MEETIQDPENGERELESNDSTGTFGSKCSTRECKILTMLTMVLMFCIVEITAGYMYNSLALVADACHMLSDGICLIIAFIATRVSKKSTSHQVLKSENTFGWARAEVIG